MDKINITKLLRYLIAENTRFIAEVIVDSTVVNNGFINNFMRTNYLKKIQ